MRRQGWLRRVTRYQDWTAALGMALTDIMRGLSWRRASIPNRMWREAVV
jgi:hypothetical protein